MSDELTQEEISERIGEPFTLTSGLTDGSLARTWTHQDIAEIKEKASQMWEDCHEPRQPAPEYSLPAGQCDNADEQAVRRKWLKLRPRDVVIDIGSADGSWSIPAALAGATVHAIDVNDRTRLAENALAAFKEHDSDTGIHFHQFFAYSRNGVAEIDQKQIPAFTLDTFVLSEGIRSVDFVKIDVEGHELEVLLGMAGILKRFKPDVVVEVHIETVPTMPSVTVEEVKDLLPDYRFDVQYAEYCGKSYCFLYATARKDGE